MAVRHDADPKALMAARRREAAKPGRQKKSGRGSGLTPRVRQAIELIVFGEDLTPAKRLKEAAAAVGISDSALRAALLKPAVDAFYRQQLTLYRNGERAQSLRTLAEIRDDPKLKENAAGATAQIKAASLLAFDQPNQTVQTNVQVNVDGRQVTPGYVIDLTGAKEKRLKYLEEIVKQNDLTIPVEDVFSNPPHPMREIPEEF